MMPKCKFPGCKCTATKGSEYCLICEAIAHRALMAAIEPPAPVMPPARVWRGIEERIKQESNAMSFDLTTCDDVMMYLSEACHEADWDARVEDVKAANGGDYPSFWYRTVIASGLLKRTAAKWGDNGEIKVYINGEPQS